MSAALATALLPLLAAAGIRFAGAKLTGARIVLAVTAAVFLGTLAVPASPGGFLLRADPPGAIFGILTGFVGLAAALANLAFVGGETAGKRGRRCQTAHALGLAVLGFTLLGLYADNIGLLWLGAEGAGLAAGLAVGPNGGAARGESWQFALFGGAASLLALFGTVATALAAPARGAAAMSLRALGQPAARLDGGLMTLAFLCLVFGYGGKAVLGSLRSGAPDAAPAPLGAMLAVLLPNLPLLAILRFRQLLHPAAPLPLLLALGLAALLAGAFGLWRRGGARRVFTLAPIAWSGVVLFAFGLGGPGALLAGLLQMLLQALLQSALLQLPAWHRPGPVGTGRLRALMQADRRLAWLLGGGIFVLSGLPPSGLFVSQFLLLSETARRAPLLCLPLGLGLAALAMAILRLLGRLLRGPPAVAAASGDAWSARFWLPGLQLLATCLLALAMPWPLLRRLAAIAGGLN